MYPYQTHFHLITTILSSLFSGHSMKWFDLLFLPNCNLTTPTFSIRIKLDFASVDYKKKITYFVTVNQWYNAR